MELDPETLKLFMDLYDGRKDAWGSVEGKCNKETVTEEHYRRHLMGEVSLGVYPLLNDGTCNFFAVDLDEKDFDKAKKIRQEIKNLFLDVYIANSKGKGYHIYGFFWEPQPAKAIRTILAAILERLQIKAEIFPKQDVVSEKTPYGNYINTPCFGGWQRQFLTANGDAIDFNQAIRLIKRIDTDSLTLAVKLLPPMVPTSASGQIVGAEPKKKNKAAAKGSPNCIMNLLKGVGDGCRDDAAFCLARHLLDMGNTPSQVLATLEGWDTHNNPPIGDPKMLETKIDSAAKGYAFGCNSILKNPALSKYCVGEQDCTWFNEGKGVYCPPEIIAAPPGQMVFLVKDEKSAETIRRHNLMAVYAPAQILDHLKDKELIVVHTDPIRAEIVAKLVSSVGRTTKLVIIDSEIPNWVKNHTFKELIERAEKTEIWKAFDATDLPSLIEDISAFIGRFVVCSELQLRALSLWVLHTHLFEYAETTPYINIGSAEKRSGKTRLLEVLDLLTKDAWFTGHVTAAVLCRKIDAECPTLLLDESDAAFKGPEEYSEVLRGVLNAGYRKGGCTSVCVGHGAEIEYKDLSCFCPKAIAGIGKLPDTIADRSIPIVLKRRMADEKVDRFHRRKVFPQARELRGRIAKVVSLDLNEIEPELPNQLNDRAADCWEPLLAIAQLAGDDWYRKAVEASIALMARDAEDTSYGIKLLTDIKKVFVTERLSTTQLLDSLKALEESPWAQDSHGKTLSSARLATMLKGYGLASKPIRFGAGDDCKTLRGFYQNDFSDVWKRYLPVKPEETTEVTEEVSNTEETPPGPVDLEF
jgi:hypothetical protein